MEELYIKIICFGLLASTLIFGFGAIYMVKYKSKVYKVIFSIGQWLMIPFLIAFAIITIGKYI